MEFFNENVEQINEQLSQPEQTAPKKYYSEKHRQAQQRYREKHRAKYNEFQRDLYEKLHTSDEWKTKFNERSKKNNLIYRNKKKEILMNDPNYVAKKRGRPRKLVEPIATYEC
jgi:hypothetical protein